MKPTKYRLNLEFSDSVHQKLKKLRAATEASNTEVIRRSLAVYEMILDNGGKFTIESVDGKRETVRILKNETVRILYI